MKHTVHNNIPISYRPYDFPALFPVLSFFGTNWVVSMTEPTFLHFHNGFEIGLCLEGFGRICFHNYSIPYKAGEFTIISPLEPHISVCEKKPSHWEYIFFDPTVVLASKSSSITTLYEDYYRTLKPSVLITAESCPFLHQILTVIYREMHNQQTYYPQALRSLFLVLLTGLSELSSNQSPVMTDSSVEPVRKALLHIYDHYMENISISELAKLSFLSESYFRHLFKQIVGISPLEYIQHYRIQHACHLILLDQLTLSQIADQVGYRSISSFNRQFSQYTGLTPSVWKKEHLTKPVCQNVTSLEDSDTLQLFHY